MATLARLYNFINGQPSNADHIDAEFDAIVAFLLGSVVHKDGTQAMTGLLTLSGPPTANLHAATKAYVDAAVTTPALPGVVCMYGGAAPPTGWLLCDGAAVSRTTYSALFNAVGTTHGAGDGSTTFNVPDLRGRVPMGTGQGPGLGVNWPAGYTYGSEYLQAHTHQFTEVGVQQFWLGKQGGDAWIGLPYGTNWNATLSSGAGNMQNYQPSKAIVFMVKT